MENDKKTITISFVIEPIQGFDCMGSSPFSDCCDFNMDFTEEEIELMKRLVAASEHDSETNLMPILEGDAPELFQRIDKAARKAMFDYYLVQAAQECDIEFDEEEQRENFQKDLESGLFVPEDFIVESYNYDEVPEDEKELFDLWSEWERDKFAEEDAAWIRSRYTIDEGCIDVSDDEYICHLPEEFLQ